MPGTEPDVEQSADESPAPQPLAMLAGAIPEKDGSVLIVDGVDSISAELRQLNDERPDDGPPWSAQESDGSRQPEGDTDEPALQQEPFDIERMAAETAKATGEFARALAAGDVEKVRAMAEEVGLDPAEAAALIEPETVDPAEICDDQNETGGHCILAPGHDGPHYGWQGDNDATQGFWGEMDLDVPEPVPNDDGLAMPQSGLPGSLDTLAAAQLGQGEAPPLPEPQFGAPVAVTETAEVQGAALGVDPSPLRDAFTGVQTTRQETSGATLETTADNLVPPGAQSFDPDVNPNRDAVVYHDLELGRLADFLEQRFPDELDLSNRQEPESTVDVAIRLLTLFHATSPTAARCKTSYCNKPQGHQDAHGWVNNG